MGSAVEVSVLGAVRVRRGRDEVVLGGRRQRAVLARLALAGGRSVPVDRLIDELWDGDPPASALNTLQSYVSNLRRALAPGVIARAGDGYRLVDVDLVAARFEQLVATATGPTVAPTDREALLTEALALWHGAALGDLADEPWAVGDAVRLTELRLAALEERFAAALDLGRHTVVVADLDALAQEHPLRERLTALLVVALYRCGRQAEALRAHERLRSHLAEELGLDPGPELARLAAQVLDQDPDLAWAPPDEAPSGAPSATPAAADASTTAAAPAPAEPAADRAEPIDVGRLVLPLPPAVEERRARSTFVGRAEELARLQQLWEEVGAGGRSFVLVEGEPGAGKTRLAQQMARWVHDQGANVLWGRCTAENLLAYQPVVEALRTGSRALPPEQAAALARARPPIATLLPDVVGLDRPAARVERWDLFEAVAALFAEATTTSPVLLVVDDVQWADPATVALLDHVVRQDSPARILVLATARRPAGGPTPALDQLVVDLRRDARLAVVGLSGIGTDEVVALLDDRGVHVDRAVADALRARTGGNPFFLEALVEHGTVEAPSDARAVPASVRDLLDQRLQVLGDDALRVLSAAAVIGPRVDLAVLGPVVGLDADALLDVVDAAVASRLLVEDEELGWVGFPHALVRSALIARTTRNREARHHLRIADVVAARPGHLDREATVAQHLLAAGRLAPAVRTADACVAAGRRALSGIADEDARAWGERAIAALDAADTGTGTGADAAEARGARGEALLLVIEASRLRGDGAAAWAALQEARHLVEGDVDPSVLARVACDLALFSTAHDYPWALRPVDPALTAILDRALAVPPDVIRADRPYLLAWATITNTGSPDQARAVAWSAEAMASLDDLGGDAHGTCQVAMARRHALATPASLPERLALHPRMLIAGNTEFGLAFSARGFAAVQLLEAGQWAAAEAMEAEQRALADAHDRPWYTAYVHFLDGAHAFLEGDVERAEELYRLGASMGEPGHTGAGSQFDIGARVMSARARGREADLAPLADAVVDARPDLLVGPALRARVALASGDRATAEAALAGLDRDRLAAVGDDLLGYLVVDLLAEVAWLLGAADLGAAVAAGAAPYADQVGVIGQGAVVTGPVHRPHGLALAAAGDLDGAEEALARAVAVGEDRGWRPTVGRASQERATVLRRLGRAVEADGADAVGRAALADIPVPPA